MLASPERLIALDARVVVHLGHVELLLRHGVVRAGQVVVDAHTSLTVDGGVHGHPVDNGATSVGEDAEHVLRVGVYVGTSNGRLDLEDVCAGTQLPPVIELVGPVVVVGITGAGTVPGLGARVGGVLPLLIHECASGVPTRDRRPRVRIEGLVVGIDQCVERRDGAVRATAVVVP